MNTSLDTIPSPEVVRDVTQSAIKMMKLLSKQLQVLSATYEKMPLESSCVQIYETMEVVMESTRKIQESMVKTGNAINAEMSGSEISEEVFPDIVAVTRHEYNLLESIFQDAVDVQNNNINSSKDYSLFCSPLLYTPPKRDN